MRLRTVATALAVSIGSLAFAGAASAAPARTATLDETKLSYAWTFGPGTGFFGDALIASKAPCTQVLQTCDTTLLKVDYPGSVGISTATTDQTLVDLDVYVYSSDASGAQGDELTKGVTFAPAESVSVDVEPGYVLVRVDYMTGVGSYSGAASFTPFVPEEEEVPAE